MKRSTVRLIHSIVYRRALVQELPRLEAKLAELLQGGRELRTRRWRVWIDAGELVLVPNDSPPGLHQIPLALMHRTHEP